MKIIKIIIGIVQCLLIYPMSMSVTLFLIGFGFQFLLAICQWIVSRPKESLTIKEIRKEKLLKINKKNLFIRYF